MIFRPFLDTGHRSSVYKFRIRHTSDKTYRNTLYRNPIAPIAPCTVPINSHTTMEHVPLWSTNTFRAYKRLMSNHRLLSVVCQRHRLRFASVPFQRPRSELKLRAKKKKKRANKNVIYDYFVWWMVFFSVVLRRRPSVPCTNVLQPKNLLMKLWDVSMTMIQR